MNTLMKPQVRTAARRTSTVIAQSLAQSVALSVPHAVALSLAPLLFTLASCGAPTEDNTDPSTSSSVSSLDVSPSGPPSPTGTAPSTSEPAPTAAPTSATPTSTAPTIAPTTTAPTIAPTGTAPSVTPTEPLPSDVPTLAELDEILWQKCGLGICHVQPPHGVPPTLSGSEPATLHAQLTSYAAKNCQGGTLVVPGSAAESVLIKVVSGACDGFTMPPDPSYDSFTEEELAKITAWINAGAPNQ